MNSIANFNSTGINLPAMFVRIRNIFAKSTMFGLSPDTLFLIGMIVLCNIHLLTVRTCQSLIFQYDAVIAGDVYRLITHPFVHLSGYHFLLDAGAFLFLYTGLDEKRPSRRMLILAVCGIFGLAAPLIFAPVIYSRGLCGLSGIAHGLMAYSALEMVREPKNHKIGVAFLLSVTLKSAFEAVTGDVVFSFLHFGLCGVPIAICHTGGVMGGIFSFFILNCPDCKNPANLKKGKCAMQNNVREAAASGKSQFGLMTVRRFAPFFWTQFLGAFNDNVFKNGLMIMLAYGTGAAVAEKSDIMINVAAGLFILPFFLFSATAGQIADKYEKSMVIQFIKILEIFIMAFAAIAFYFKSSFFLTFLLFLMGTHSAFFGPIKYSIIPDHLRPDEIVGGNAMVEMGTFVAILLGLVTGNVLNPIKLSPIWISAAVCLVAIAGWLASRQIPKAAAPSPDIKINWNPLTQTWETIRYARKVHSVFLSILAISWFWFLGMAYLTQLPNYTRDVLKSSQDVYTLLLTVFSAGIGLGSLLCEKMSGRKVELGLVPLGSIGISLFGFDLFFAYAPPHVSDLMGITEFLHSPGSLRVLRDLLLIGIFGGFYIVPLFAFIQTRTESAYRARVIAANNILNALLMVISTIAGVFFLGLMNLSIPEFFLVVAIMNVVAAVYIYTVVPEFVMRFLIWIITHTIYRVRHVNLERIPDEGPAVLVCNHVSYMDGLILGGACRRPLRFVMFEPIFRIPVLKFIFKTGKAIPITSRKENEAVYLNAFEQISQALEEGEVVCLFPEGKLTRDGEIDEFKSGIEKIIARNPVPVIPLALRGLWGSFFSHQGGVPFKRLPKRFWSKVEIHAGEPVAPEDVKADDLRSRVAALRGDDK